MYILYQVTEVVRNGTNRTIANWVFYSCSYVGAAAVVFMCAKHGGFVRKHLQKILVSVSSVLLTAILLNMAFDRNEYSSGEKSFMYAVNVGMTNISLSCMCVLLGIKFVYLMALITHSVVLFNVCLVVLNPVVATDSDSVNPIFLLNFLLVGGSIIFATGAYMLEKLIRDLFVEKLKTEVKKNNIQRLLENILPEAVITRLARNQRTAAQKKKPDSTVASRKETPSFEIGMPMHLAEHHPEATVLFADMVGFTSYSSTVDSITLVGVLNEIFSAFDLLALNCKVEKIKTVRLSPAHRQKSTRPS
jgi:hypothetical protein